ncbi:FERM and PDZ domain-containing protein 4 [Trichonephila clavata]|uniref:FERM and PDZ domain-containing protein 4 n=1 Tax=Trichonephila clavata TaxID=2740835 RepID=A0A8X6M241_TRICU|nr:FERM and PDZ domain-containing protein 4 [Trichonephila clavata]
MVAHLKKVFPSKITVIAEDRDKLTAAKDALLKEVALAYFYTVEAAQKVFGNKVDQLQMSTLMQRATALATSLTSLMRTLRAMC